MVAIAAILSAAGLGVGATYFLVAREQTPPLAQQPPSADVVNVTTTTTEGTTSTTALLELSFSEAQLAEQFGDAVFRVESVGCDYTGSGSGFAIDKHHVVTNWHVVENDTTPTLIHRDGRRLQGRVIGWSERPDVAVIEVTSVLAPTLEWAAASSLTEGERLVALGYPVPGTVFSVTPGVIVSFRTNAGVREAIRTDASLDRGNSGGPALTTKGHVAGVVTELESNMSGFQFVPLIYTSTVLKSIVDGFIARPQDLTPACLTVPDLPPVDVGDYPNPYDPFWTVILASVDVVTEGFDRAVSRADHFWGLGVPVDILLSTDFPSLNPGYWVVYAGRFATAEEARGYCQDLKPLVGSCYHRWIGWDASRR